MRKKENNSGHFFNAHSELPVVDPSKSVLLVPVIGLAALHSFSSLARTRPVRVLTPSICLCRGGGATEEDRLSCMGWCEARPRCDGIKEPVAAVGAPILVGMRQCVAVEAQNENRASQQTLKISSLSAAYVFIMVPRRGLEPPRGCPH